MKTHYNLPSEIFSKIWKGFEIFGVAYEIVSIFVENIYPWRNQQIFEG